MDKPGTNIGRVLEPAGAKSNSCIRPVVVLLAAALIALGIQPALAAGPPHTTTTLTPRLLARASVDECFSGIGSPNNVYPAGPTCSQGQPKINQGYLWGLAKAGNHIWIGTAANPLCIIISAFGQELGFSLPGYETASYVCEFSQSNYLVDHPDVPAALGDWRPPQIYMYNLKSAQIVTETPDDPLIEQTLGLRSAGTNHGVAILAGPTLGTGIQQSTGINMFAFDAVTGAYLGSENFPQYTDIRQWVVAQGVLYTGVQMADGTGAVLRWRGNKKNPFQFEVVGNLDLSAANIALHRARLFVTTWQKIESIGDPNATPIGLWMSPLLGSKGLTSADAGGWTKIWNINQYEPDLATASSYNGGALASFDGYLYFGTINVPFAAVGAHFMANPGDTVTPTSLALAALGTFRPTSVFRCCKWGKNVSKSAPGAAGVQLLYGFDTMPAYNPDTQAWTLVPNANVYHPMYGRPGFGNPFNAYTWTMGVYRKQLYVGTFDWSYLLLDAPTALLQQMGIADLQNGPLSIDGLTNSFAFQYVSQVIQNYLLGADLWKFTSSKDPAVPESLTGVINNLNYGLRTMVTDGSGMYLGTADPMNLKVSPPSTQQGGWELLQLRAF
jgi:hypothetical protein